MKADIMVILSILRVLIFLVASFNGEKRKLSPVWSRFSSRRYFLGL